MRTVRTLAIIMAAQPLTIFFCAYMIPGGVRSAWWLIAILLGFLAVAVAIRTSRWPRQDKIVASAVYATLALVSLVGLLPATACSLGDCI